MWLGMSVGTCVARVSLDAIVGGGRGEVCRGGWASTNPTSFTFGSQLQWTVGSSGSSGMRRGVRALRAQDIVDCGYVWVAQGGVKRRRVWNPPPSTCTTELMPGWGIPSAGVQPGGSCWRREVHPIRCPHLESSETNGFWPAARFATSAVPVCTATELLLPGRRIISAGYYCSH